MSDPRGHGFKRGRGKWHAPTAKMEAIDPVDLGWSRTADGYELNGVILKAHGLGWLYTQVATIGGIERRVSQYVGNALLPRLTAEFMQEELL